MASSYAELCADPSGDPFGTGEARNAKIKAVYDFWKNNPSLDTEALASDLEISMRYGFVGGLGVFVRDPEGFPESPFGVLRIVHGLAQHTLPGSIHTKKIFAYVDDVWEETGIDLIEFNHAVLRKVEPDDDTAGVSGAVFIPFCLLSRVMGKNLDAKEALATLTEGIEEQGLDGVCEPLVEFLTVASNSSAVTRDEIGLPVRGAAEVYGHRYRHILLGHLPGLREAFSPVEATAASPKTAEGRGDDVAGSIKDLRMAFLHEHALRRKNCQAYVCFVVVFGSAGVILYFLLTNPNLTWT